MASFTKMTTIKVAYLRPSPMLDRDGDDPGRFDGVAVPGLWFDTEAPEAFERDNFDTIATTVQHLRTLARSEIRFESPKEISVSSVVFGASVGTQKVEGEFAVRNVTKQTDAAGRLTDEGRETRPSEVDGPAKVSSSILLNLNKRLIAFVFQPSIMSKIA